MKPTFKEQSKTCCTAHQKSLFSHKQIWFLDVSQPINIAFNFPTKSKKTSKFLNIVKLILIS